MMPGENVDLTSDIVLGEIWQYRKGWEENGDWWWGTTKPYKDLPYGYDVNVCHDADGEPFRAVIYKLGPKDAAGVATTTYQTVFVFPVPTKEEYELEGMLDMNNFAIKHKSKEELKAEAVRDILNLDLTMIIEPCTAEARMQQDDGAYNMVVSMDEGSKIYSVKVYEGLQTGKNLRTELMDVQIDKDGYIVTATGIDIMSYLDAMQYATKNKGAIMVDMTTGPIERTIYYDKDTDRLCMSDNSTIENTDPTIRTWIVKPQTAESASLMVLHEASYFNGRLVSIKGQQDMFVNVGDNLIADDNTEYLVAVYRVNK